jgi:hypothetical protein
VHLLSLVGAAGALLLAVRGQWFFGDEWAFITVRELGATRWARCCDRTTSTCPPSPCSVPRTAAPLRPAPYWPYIAVVLGLHLLVSHLLWRLLVRAGARLVTATAAATVFALLGSGGENLLWAFQTVRRQPVRRDSARCCWPTTTDRALLARRGRRRLSLVAVGCSGVGVAAVATVALAVCCAAGGGRRPP